MGRQVSTCEPKETFRCHGGQKLANTCPCQVSLQEEGQGVERRDKFYALTIRTASELCDTLQTDFQQHFTSVDLTDV